MPYVPFSCLVLHCYNWKVRYLCFVRTLINHPPFVSLFSLLFYHIKLFHMLFVSVVLSHWLHRYLYNYFATTFLLFLFCFFFFFWNKLLTIFTDFWQTFNFQTLTNGQILLKLLQLKHWNFFKKIQLITIITHKFFVITQINAIHRTCSQNFPMALNAFKQLEKKQKSKSCMFFIRSGPSFWKNKE